MRIVAILQARMGSTRLPGKVLLPLAGKPMLQHIIERVQRSTKIHDVVVAVPNEPDSGHLETLTRTTQSVYARFDHIPAADLVDRYLGAAKAYAADLIVRVPCDNPCIDPAYIDAAIEAYLHNPFVYYSNTTAYVGETAVDGIGAEVVSRSRLQWLDQRTTGRADWREHPHRYFEDCGLLSLPNASIRLDVNTQTDYEFICDIYSHFGHNRFTADEVVGYLHAKEDHHATQVRNQ